MSPTLLELIVAVLLIWVAWQIGALLAPRVIAAFVAYWRSPRPTAPPGGWRSDKTDSSVSHGRSDQR